MPLFSVKVKPVVMSWVSHFMAWKLIMAQFFSYWGWYNGATYISEVEGFVCPRWKWFWRGVIPSTIPQSYTGSHWPWWWFFFLFNVCTAIAPGSGLRPCCVRCCINSVHGDSCPKELAVKILPGNTVIGFHVSSVYKYRNTDELVGVCVWKTITVWIMLIYIFTSVSEFTKDSSECLTVVLWR